LAGALIMVLPGKEVDLLGTHHEGIEVEGHPVDWMVGEWDRDLARESRVVPSGHQVHIVRHVGLKDPELEFVVKFCNTLTGFHFELGEFFQCSVRAVPW